MQARKQDASARVAAMVVGHQETLLRVARQVSICADDAHDAVQRGLEIYLRRLDRVDEATELAWLKVVVRNEALAVRKARATTPTVDGADLDAHVSPARDPHDRAASAERIARSSEALRRLKRDEARALIAKSMGLSYEEISQRFGWTYTKVNRCLSEGRARFLRVYKDIEEGVECGRFAPALLDLADGVADTNAVLELRPHLRRCPSCRATVRHLHGGRGQRAVAALALPGKWIWDRLAHVKAEAYGAAARVSELSAAAPLGGGRGAAATALVGLCLGGATCVVGLDDGDGDRRRDLPPVVEVAKRVAVAPPAGRAAKREILSAPAAALRPSGPRARAQLHAPLKPRAEFEVPDEREEFAPSEERGAPPPDDTEFAVAESTPKPPPAEFVPAPPPAEFASAE